MSDLAKTNATQYSNVCSLTQDLLSQQESAWKNQADSWPIESALTSFNKLSNEDQHQILLDLIFHEVVLRERLGQYPTVEEYQRAISFASR